jgi:methanogenic corrinoid protein MtbC1
VHGQRLGGRGGQPCGVDAVRDVVGVRPGSRPGLEREVRAARVRSAAGSAEQGQREQVVAFSGPRALLACPAGEQHDISLIAFGLALREHGWRITYIGTDTPVATTAETASALRPDLVVMAAVDPLRFSACVEELGDVSAQFPLALAGAGAGEELAAQIGATYLDEGPVEAAAAIASLERP